MNPRPLGYEPNELPDCSTPRNFEFLFELPIFKRNFDDLVTLRLRTNVTRVYDGQFEASV